jgi:pyrroline-5-carboxylate reductase
LEKGAIALSADFVSEETLFLQNPISKIGETVRVQESGMVAVTGLSGSGSSLCF